MELNVKELKKIAKANHTAEIITTSLAMRERLSHNTNIPRMETQLMASGERIDDKDYNNFWKALADAGAGKIIYGRGKKPDVFRWHYNLKEVAQVAVDGSEIAVQAIDEKLVGQRKRGYKRKIKVVSEKRTGDIILRKAEKNVETPQVLNHTTDMVKENEYRVDRKIFVTLSDGSLYDTTIKSAYSMADVSNIVKAIQQAIAG